MRASQMRWVVGNWKMNLGPQRSISLAKEIAALKIPDGVQAWIAPSTESLMSVAAICKGTKILVGSQNACGEKPGAFTGELSVPALKEIGCGFAIIGHSERRHVFGESVELCAKRAIGILSQDFKVIFCVGETLEERRSGRTEDVLREQLRPLRDAVPPEQRENLIIAYEPVWAIGTGIVAKEEEYTAAHNIIADRLANININLPILYGGSVAPNNFDSILRAHNVSGGLVGGASLDVEKFETLIKLAGALAN